MLNSLKIEALVKTAQGRDKIFNTSMEEPSIHMVTCLIHYQRQLQWKIVFNFLFTTLKIAQSERFWPNNFY